MSDFRIWLPIGLLSLYLAGRWLYDRRRPDARVTLPTGQVITLGLIFAGLIGLVAGGFRIGGALRTDEGGVFAILVGLTVAGFSVLHPSWLWEYARVPLLRLDSDRVSLRYLLSDAVAFLLYLVLGLALVAVGAIRLCLRANDIAHCSALYSAVTDSHGR